jgi:hypothetical protein
VLIVAGLYSVLWGKHKEGLENKDDEIPEAIKDSHVNGTSVVLALNGDIEANEVKKAEANKLSSVAICMPFTELPMKA